MVESVPLYQSLADIAATHEYFKLFVQLRGPFMMVFLPYLSKRQINRFNRLNKKCNALINPRVDSSVNYKVLYEAWGYILTAEQAAFAKTSLLNALTCCPQSHIYKCGDFICKNPYHKVTGKKVIPDFEILAGLSQKEAAKLRPTKVHYQSAM